MDSKIEKRGKIYQRPTAQLLPSISLGQLLLEKMRENTDRVFTINECNGNSVTHKELLEKSVKLANFLQTRGIKIGDRISIASENRWDWWIPACAALYIGAIVAPYNPMYTEWELQNALNISKPKIIFVSRRSEGIFTKILPGLSFPIELIELDEQPFLTTISTLADILNREKPVNLLKYKAVDIGDNSKCPAAILCSSGTTGMPKGVTLSHRNLLSCLFYMRKLEFLDINGDDRLLIFLPFFHGYAFGMMLSCIYTGSIAVLIPSFEPNLFLSTVQKQKITHLPVVPPVLTFLAKHPLVEKYDFRSVREVMCGAAPLSRDLVRLVKARLGLQYVRNAYGMTELSIVTNMSSRDDDDNSLRSLIPGLLGKIVDPETRKSLDAGQVGEICCKGSHVMLGYWNNPEATKQIIDEDGWLHTGDLGYYDDQNRLHVIDRLKELIKYKGYQVSPSELEIVLLSHPAVKDVAVAGKPDELSGELPMALIVKQPNATITVKEITEFVKQKLSPQKWLRGGVQFVDAIPKNSTGKILRRELRTMMAKL